ncbi:hypothetical protein [Methylosinus sp. Ce-a6]|uniref:hypothetical protein n=1 Tax=Methylosinus sp. Ce-a6 TaxID=2172005 RepID=UPI00135B7B5A|nr:hypothetical protein [Methylosinus sp. Ce-a6]
MSDGGDDDLLLKRFDMNDPTTWELDEPSAWALSFLRLAKGEPAEFVKRLRAGVAPPEFILRMLADLIDIDGPGHEGARLVFKSEKMKRQRDAEQRYAEYFHETIRLVSNGERVEDAWETVAKKYLISVGPVRDAWAMFERFDDPILRNFFKARGLS